MRIFLVSLLLLTGCATMGTSITEPWVATFVGQEGYIREAPLIIELKDNGWSNSSLFKPCETVKIQDVITAGIMENAFLLRQGDNTFYAWGSRDYLKKYKLAGNVGPNEYLKSSLPGKKRAIALKSGKVDSQDLMCSRQVWTTMLPEELIFVRGRPERINRTTTSGLIQEQWIYKKPGGDQFHFDYFYFHNGQLLGAT